MTKNPRGPASVLLTRLRRSLVASIRRRLKPIACQWDPETKRLFVMRKEGSRSGGARRFRFGKARGTAIHVFDAFTLDGVMRDVGRGPEFWPWIYIPVEDLVLLDQFLTRAVERGQLE